MNHIAAIALGSNLASNVKAEHDGRAANLRSAIAHLASLGQVLAESSFYDTAPVGYLDQPRFLNAAAILETRLAPLELLDRLLAIERTIGRDRSTDNIAKGPRIIDLDLILYEDRLMETPSLTLPHPAMRERRFVLEPLAEIAPHMVDPISGLTVAQLLVNLPTERSI